MATSSNFLEQLSPSFICTRPHNLRQCVEACNGHSNAWCSKRQSSCPKRMIRSPHPSAIKALSPGTMRLIWCIHPASESGFWAFYICTLFFLRPLSLDSFVNILPMVDDVLGPSILGSWGFHYPLTSHILQELKINIILQQLTSYINRPFVSD